MASESRQYDLVVYGATGYTGKYTAEYLHSTGPANLKWAIAGRNASKVNDVANSLKDLKAVNALPAVEIISHDATGLESLARKTKVLISTVGPFSKYGTPVVEACVKSGTHYLDVTGEVPWVHDIISRFHEKARKDGTILIPQSGIDSVPSDILAYKLVKYSREHYDEGVVECISSVQNMVNGMSGGTADSALSLADAYPASYLLKAFKPFALSPVPPSAEQKTKPGGGGILAAIRGYISVPELGYLTDWPGNSMDRAIVHRSWGLFDGGAFYGKKFRFAQLMKARNALRAIMQAYVLSLATILLAIRPGRWLLKRALPKPGEGPTREATEKMFVKYKALAISESGKKVVGELALKGSMYYWTGVFVAEAALEILSGTEGRAKEGGVVTPATLEMGYVKRLEKVMSFDISPKL